MREMNPITPEHQKILSYAQISGMEAAAFASGKADRWTMMEQAAHATIDEILGKWPNLRTAHAPTVILCGPGRNGGDGYAIARILHGRGWPVRVEELPSDSTQPPEAVEMRTRWKALVPAPVTAPELVIDAIFDIGHPRPLDLGGLKALWDAARYRVAVDMATGLDAETGVGIAPHLHADLTVTFHAAKPGHYLADGPTRSGDLVVADLGLTSADHALRLAAPEPCRLSKTGGHKFDYGHAVVLSGPAGHGGAARMAARAALRIGAGLVTMLAPQDALSEHAARLDAIMLREVNSQTDIEAVLEDSRIRAICLGPGLGVERATALLPAVLAARRPTVLDADALTAIARDDNLADLHPDCVLTPHQGEFARLFPDLAEAMSRDPAKGGWPIPKHDAVHAAARRAGCVVLLKGHDTTIADPCGNAVLAHSSYDRAAPWLATAGAGDVLAGIITGLLARGLAPLEAAEAGAWLHVEAARTFGPGLIAEDLAEMIPPVFRSLGL